MPVIFRVTVSISLSTAVADLIIMRAVSATAQLLVLTAKILYTVHIKEGRTRRECKPLPKLTTMYRVVNS